MSKKNSHKKRVGVVYSTDPDYNYALSDAFDAVTPEKGDQDLKVRLEKKGRAGKQATVVKGFTGKPDDLNALAKTLKSKCGVGGSAKDGEIIIQGNVVDKVIGILQQEGYSAKKSGG